MTLDLRGSRTIPWKDALPAGLSAAEVVFGRDETQVGEVQVAVASASARPTKAALDVDDIRVTAWMAVTGTKESVQ